MYTAFMAEITNTSFILGSTIIMFLVSLFTVALAIAILVYLVKIYKRLGEAK